eukprot:69168-Karenia_brevis.AAC.1
MMYHKIQHITSSDSGEPIDDGMVARAIYILKPATAVGMDLWSPVNLRRPPSKAFRELAEILQQ